MIEYTYINNRLISKRDIVKDVCYLSESTGKKFMKALCKSMFNIIAMVLSGFMVYQGTIREMSTWIYIGEAILFIVNIYFIVYFFVNEF